jgi:hypothetical protein
MLRSISYGEYGITATQSGYQMFEANDQRRMTNDQRVNL